MSLKLVSAKLKTARLEAGFTLPQLADAAGISKGNLSKIECHASNLSVSTLMRLAKALKTRPCKLLP